MENRDRKLPQRLATGGLVMIAALSFSACFGEGDGRQDGPGSEPPPAEQDLADPGAPQDQQESINHGDPSSNHGDGPNVEPEPELHQLQLAAGGQANFAIVISEAAASDHEVAAQELADYLERISGASFEVTYGDGSEGIVLGRPGDFEALPIEGITFGEGVFEREDYVIRSTEEGLFLLGSTPLAVRFAVWDTLYRLGHRQFFPTETWEVVPEHDVLTIAVDAQESPDYYNRQGPRGSIRVDLRPWAVEAWEDWQLRNRTTPTFTLHTGHAYDSVIAANQAAFDNTPEYWGLVDGQRRSSAQPNVAHPDVQQMFIDHALSRFATNPARDSVAMDPRDGNHWSQSEESRAIGGPSEQAVYLANLVAEAVVDEYGEDKYVGMYGYSHHSPPPQIDVHPNVIISLATSFIRGGYTFEEMIDGWSERANMIGIREYYALWRWHYSMPGHGARAADTNYLRDTIAHFHARGARFMNAESNDSWGPYGLGYYLAARMMWDVGEAQRMEELIDDFVTRAFGPAKAPMAEFYELIDGSTADPYVPARPRPLNDDFVGRMYRLLEQARELAAGHEQVLARLDDLILYTHYVELYRRFATIEGPQRQQAFDDFVSFAWRTRETMMAESLAMVHYINIDVQRDSNLSWAPGRTTYSPSTSHRVDEDKPFSHAEIEAILQEGIANHDLLEFEFDQWEDSGIFEPAYFDADIRGWPTNNVGRGPIDAILSTTDGTLPAITLAAGQVFDDRGPLRWVLTDTAGNLVDQGEVPPDEEPRTFELSASAPGEYRFAITNTGQGFVWNYEPRGAKLTILAGGDYELRANWYTRLYFYVPEGIEEIFIAGTMNESRHDFIDGDGHLIDHDAIDAVQGFTIVPVPQGQDGSVWTLAFRGYRPEIRFLNIPGYVAFSPDELLLPQEVVDELP